MRGSHRGVLVGMRSLWDFPGRTHLGGPGVGARLGAPDHPLHPIESRLGAAPCGTGGGEEGERGPAGRAVSPQAGGVPQSTYRRGRGQRGAGAAASSWTTEVRLGLGLHRSGFKRGRGRRDGKKTRCHGPIEQPWSLLQNTHEPKDQCQNHPQDSIGLGQAAPTPGGTMPPLASSSSAHLGQWCREFLQPLALAAL